MIVLKNLYLFVEIGGICSIEFHDNRTPKTIIFYPE